jgi:hypothetical protein
MDTHLGEYVEARGLIQSARPDADDPDLQVWSVDGRRVRVDPARVEGLAVGELPPLGASVVIKGRLQDGVVRVATELDSARIMPEVATRIIAGTIQALPQLDRVGVWTVQTEAGPIDVKVGSRAIVDARLGPATVGARVRILAQAEGDTFTALRVTTDRAP